MGIILNPIAYRVGYRQSWYDAWYLQGWVYSVFLHDILFIKSFIYFLFFRFFRYRKSNWVFSHINLFVLNNKINLDLYLYDSTPSNFFDRIVNRYGRFSWRRMFLISGWFKRNLYNRRTRLQVFHMFSQFVRFFYDMLEYEHLGLILGIYKNDNRLYRHLTRKENRYLRFKEKLNKRYRFFCKYKIFLRLKKKKNVKYKWKKNVYKVFFKITDPNIVVARLRKKEDFTFFRTFRRGKFFFMKKRKRGRSPWLPWEKIRPFKKPWSMMSRSYNGLTLKWWITRYNFFYRSFIDSVFYNKKNENWKTNEKFFGNISYFFSEKKIKSFLKVFNYVNSNYRLFFNFLIFLKALNRRLDRYKNKIQFTKHWFHLVLKFYMFFFLKKKILICYKKFFELVFKWVEYNVKVNIFLIDNSCVTASFISRFIAIGLKSRYNFSDMMFPIKNSLKKLMYARKWSKLCRDSKVNRYKNQNFILFRDYLSIKNKFDLKIFSICKFIYLNNFYIEDDIKYFKNRFHLNFINILKFFEDKNFKLECSILDFVLLKNLKVCKVFINKFFLNLQKIFENKVKNFLKIKFEFLKKFLIKFYLILFFNRKIVKVRHINLNFKILFKCINVYGKIFNVYNMLKSCVIMKSIKGYLCFFFSKLLKFFFLKVIICIFIYKLKFGLKNFIKFFWFFFFKKVKKINKRFFLKKKSYLLNNNVRNFLFFFNKILFMLKNRKFLSRSVNKIYLGFKLKKFRRFKNFKCFFFKKIKFRKMLKLFKFLLKKYKFKNFKVMNSYNYNYIKNKICKSIKYKNYRYRFLKFNEWFFKGKLKKKNLIQIFFYFMCFFYNFLLQQYVLKLSILKIYKSFFFNFVKFDFLFFKNLVLLFLNFNRDKYKFNMLFFIKRFFDKKFLKLKNKINSRKNFALIMKKKFVIDLINFKKFDVLKKWELSREFFLGLNINTRSFFRVNKLLKVYFLNLKKLKFFKKLKIIQLYGNYFLKKLALYKGTKIYKKKLREWIKLKQIKKEKRLKRQKNLKKFYKNLKLKKKLYYKKKKIYGVRRKLIEKLKKIKYKRKKSFIIRLKKKLYLKKKRLSFIWFKKKKILKKRFFFRMFNKFYSDIKTLILIPRKQFKKMKTSFRKKYKKKKMSIKKFRKVKKIFKFIHLLRIIKKKKKIRRRTYKKIFKKLFYVLVRNLILSYFKYKRLRIKKKIKRRGLEKVLYFYNGIFLKSKLDLMKFKFLFEKFKFLKNFFNFYSKINYFNLNKVDKKYIYDKITFIMNFKYNNIINNLDYLFLSFNNDNINLNFYVPVFLEKNFNEFYKMHVFNISNMFSEKNNLNPSKIYEFVYGLSLSISLKKSLKMFMFNIIFLKIYLFNYKKFVDYLRFFISKKSSEKKLPFLFLNKEKRMKYFDSNNSILYGYKFHFVGRFTRKQRSANLWFIRGSMPYSNMLAKIEYSVSNVVLKYSICSIKVWLYKSKIAPKYRIRLI